MKLTRHFEGIATIESGDTVYRINDMGLTCDVYEQYKYEPFVFVGSFVFDNRDFDNDSDILECFERWLAAQKQAIEDTHENFSCRYPYYCPFICCSERY